MIPDEPTRVRLASLLAALSIVTDIGVGREPETAMQACLVAMRLAEAMGVDPGLAGDVYFTTMLRYIACTAYAHEEAALAGGDEIAARAYTTTMDLGNPRELLSYYFLRVGSDTAPLRRVGLVATSLPRTMRALPELIASHCEVGTSMARRLTLGAGVVTALAQIYERWDGKGGPNKLSGDALCLPIRMAHVATQAVAFLHTDGVEGACAMVEQRSGGYFDPGICEAFSRCGPQALRELEGIDAWEAAVLAEPEPQRWLSISEIDGVAHAFGDMADLKTTFTRGHSTEVAELVVAAVQVLGLDGEAPTLGRRAGLLHDLGRVGIPNGVWEKPGRLTMRDWEQVRLYPYHTERILARSPVLEPLGRVAGMHHERQDGSGYYRALAGAAIPMVARVLAAAEAYQAMTQDRPHRPAMSPEAAADTLQQEARGGRFDPDAVRAVLEAAGIAPTRRRTAWPAGLSDREVEVLRLIARGASYREVAKELVISPRTAAHHVQHIYNKIAVSTRAAAALFAMEHNLLS